MKLSEMLVSCYSFFVFSSATLGLSCVTPGNGSPFPGWPFEVLVLCMCLIAGLRHNVDFRLLARSVPGDSGDSNQEGSCPYQVASKYLKSTVPGPISSKGLLRDLWKTPQCSNDSCWWNSRECRAVKMSCCFICQQSQYLSCNKMPGLIITNIHSITHIALLEESSFFYSQD